MLQKIYNYRLYIIMVLILSSSIVRADKIIELIASDESVSESYKPRVDLTGKIGYSTNKASKRNITRLGFVLPVSQSIDKYMAYLTVIGVKDTARHIEGNFGFGYRKFISTNWIIGGYGFYDLRVTANENLLKQLTFGVETFSENLEFRLNGYIPIKKNFLLDDHNIYRAKYSPHTDTTLFDIRQKRVVEKAVGGFDVEVGGSHDSLSKLKMFAAYYYFNGSNTTPVIGGRIRGDISIFHWLTIEAEASYDGKRKFVSYLGGRLSWNFGSTTAGKSWRYDKMTQLPVRDIDVMEDEQIFVEQKFAASKKGKTAIYLHSGIEKNAEIITDRNSVISDDVEDIAGLAIAKGIQLDDFVSVGFNDEINTYTVDNGLGSVELAALKKHPKAIAAYSSLDVKIKIKTMREDVKKAKEKAEAEARLRQEAEEAKRKQKEKAEEEARLRQEAEEAELKQREKAKEEERLKKEANKKAKEEERLKKEANKKAKEEERLKEEANKKAKKEERLKEQNQQKIEELEAEKVRLSKLKDKTKTKTKNQPPPIPPTNGAPIPPTNGAPIPPMNGAPPPIPPMNGAPPPIPPMNGAPPPIPPMNGAPPPIPPMNGVPGLPGVGNANVIPGAASLQKDIYGNKIKKTIQAKKTLDILRKATKQSETRQQQNKDSAVAGNLLSNEQIAKDTQLKKKRITDSQKTRKKTAELKKGLLGALKERQKKLAKNDTKNVGLQNQQITDAEREAAIAAVNNMAASIQQDKERVDHKFIALYLSNLKKDNQALLDETKRNTLGSADASDYDAAKHLYYAEQAQKEAKKKKRQEVSSLKKALKCSRRRSVVLYKQKQKYIAEQLQNVDEDNRTDKKREQIAQEYLVKMTEQERQVDRLAQQLKLDKKNKTSEKLLYTTYKKWKEHRAELVKVEKDRGVRDELVDGLVDISMQDYEQGLQKEMVQKREINDAYGYNRGVKWMQDKVAEQYIEVQRKIKEQIDLDVAANANNPLDAHAIKLIEEEHMNSLKVRATGYKEIYDAFDYDRQDPGFEKIVKKQYADRVEAVTKMQTDDHLNVAEANAAYNLRMQKKSLIESELAKAAQWDLIGKDIPWMRKFLGEQADKVLEKQAIADIDMTNNVDVVQTGIRDNMLSKKERVKFMKAAGKQLASTKNKKNKKFKSRTLRNDRRGTKGNAAQMQKAFQAVMDVDADDEKGEPFKIYNKMSSTLTYTDSMVDDFGGNVDTVGKLFGEGRGAVLSGYEVKREVTSLRGKKREKSEIRVDKYVYEVDPGAKDIDENFLAVNTQPSIQRGFKMVTDVNAGDDAPMIKKLYTKPRYFLTQAGYDAEFGTSYTLTGVRNSLLSDYITDGKIKKVSVKLEKDLPTFSGLTKACKQRMKKITGALGVYEQIDDSFVVTSNSAIESIMKGNKVI